jgi:Rieske 2Fe-2S family protein
LGSAPDPGSIVCGLANTGAALARDSGIDRRLHCLVSIDPDAAMTATTNMASPDLADLLDSRREGHGMPRAFYTTEALFSEEMRRIWHRGWLFAGLEIEIPNPGDFLTMTVDTTPVLVMRGDDGAVRAFHNVCRHRGTQLCRQETGHVRAIVCPYHSWTYSRRGELVACHGMHEGVDKSALGLKPLHAEVVSGFVYVSLAQAPSAFDAFRKRFAQAGAPQGFDRARIAKSVEYEVDANWKLVWENNRECYHCTPRHPQYVKSNFDVYEEEYATDAIRAEIAAALLRTQSQWIVPEDSASHPAGGLATFPDPDHDLWYTCNRTALAAGFETESMDGKRVAPLMGDYREANVGVLRMRSLPNFWLHASCDHAVVTRMLPAGPRKTLMRSYWLVNRDAREGDDYDLDRLLPFWQITNEQDWEICKWQQKGVDSLGYEPGPLSQRKEYNVDAYIRWYLKAMRPPSFSNASRG